MKICVPVNQDRGLQSEVCEHFGSAPMFLLVDTDTEAYISLPNTQQHHRHGMCQPLAAIAGHPVDAVVVWGIGKGALHRLRAGNLEVYLARHPTVAATLEALKAGTLQPATPATACGHHGRGQGGGAGQCTGHKTGPRHRGRRAP